MLRDFFTRRDALSGLFLTAIGAGFLFLSLGFPMGTMRHVGAGVFPALVAGLLILVGLLVIVKASDTRLKLNNPRPLLLILAALAAFAMLLPTAGFIVATVVLILLSARAHAGFTWVSALVLAALVTVFGGAVFIYGLGLPLPLVGPMLRF